MMDGSALHALFLFLFCCLQPISYGVLNSCWINTAATGHLLPRRNLNSSLGSLARWNNDVFLKTMITICYCCCLILLFSRLCHLNSSAVKAAQCTAAPPAFDPLLCDPWVHPRPAELETVVREKLIGDLWPPRSPRYLSNAHDRQTDGQTDGQRDIQTDRRTEGQQTDRRTEGHTDRHMAICEGEVEQCLQQTDRRTEGHTDIQIQIDKQTGRIVTELFHSLVSATVVANFVVSFLTRDWGIRK